MHFKFVSRVQIKTFNQSGLSHYYAGARLLQLWLSHCVQKITKEYKTLTHWLLNTIKRPRYLYHLWCHYFSQQKEGNKKNSTNTAISRNTAILQNRVETRCHTGTATLHVKFRANNRLLDVTLSNSNITRHNIHYTSHASLRPLALHLTHETLALKIFHDG